MLILSQYHIFDPYKINIYSVAASLPKYVNDKTTAAVLLLNGQLPC
jgi:hypothetical protein